LNWIEPRSFKRGENAGEDANEGAKAEGDEHGSASDNGGVFTGGEGDEQLDEAKRDDEAN
jgi:hypothetical protein